MKILPWTRSCFVCGEQNPIGLNLRFRIEDGPDGKQMVSTTVKFKPEHVGFVSWVHGGLIATVLDETMFWSAAVALKNLVACAQLEVRFFKPILPNVDIQVSAVVQTQYKNRLAITEATAIAHNGEILAKATGKYIPIPQDQKAKFHTDLVGILPWTL